MKAILSLALCLLSSGLILAQGVTQLPSQYIYRGNEFYLELNLTRPDSVLRSQALLYTGPDRNQLVEAVNQPLVTRAGRRLGISWSKSQTATLPEPRAWLVIRAGDAIRFQGWVYTSTNPQVTTPPGSYTVVSPIAELVGTGTATKIYPLSNAITGTNVMHNKANRFVTGTFFREDTGQVDNLWRIEVVSDNSIRLTGPPGEFFSGRLVLSFPYQQPSN